LLRDRARLKEYAGELEKKAEEGGGPSLEWPILSDTFFARAKGGAPNLSGACKLHAQEEAQHRALVPSCSLGIGRSEARGV